MELAGGSFEYFPRQIFTRPSLLWTVGLQSIREPAVTMWNRRRCTAQEGSKTSLR